MKILEPTPSTKPSLLESIATLVTEFEKPVTGTKVPPPECRAILSKTPKDVRSEVIAITDRVVNKYAFLVSVKSEKSIAKSSEIRQINPPVKKAKIQFLKTGDEGACRFISDLYF